MTSYQDINRAILRQQIPTLWATAGLQYRIVSSAPGVEPKTFGAWTSVVGHFEEIAHVTLTDQDTLLTLVRRMGWVTISDVSAALLSSVGTYDGHEFSISSNQPHFTVSAKFNNHTIGQGVVTLALVRDEPLSVGPQRGAQR